MISQWAYFGRLQLENASNSDWKICRWQPPTPCKADAFERKYYIFLRPCFGCSMKITQRVDDRSFSVPHTLTCTSISQPGFHWYLYYNSVMTDLWVKHWFEFKLDMKAYAWSSFIRQFLPCSYFKYLLIFLAFWIYFRNLCERWLFISAWWTMVEVLLLLIAQSLQSGCLPHRCRHVCQNQCCHTCHCLYIPRINHCELHCSNSYWGNQS